MEFLLLAFLFVAAFVLYFLPTIIALKRDHRNMAPIAVINFLLGWSLVGWVIALAWSLSSNVEACS